VTIAPAVHRQVFSLPPGHPEKAMPNRRISLGGVSTRLCVLLFPLLCALFFPLFSIVIVPADFLKPAQGLAL
jgi:hypothetical protein